MVAGTGGVGGLSAGTARRPRWVALADLQSQSAPPTLSHQATESSTSTSSQRGTDVLVMLVVLVLVALVVPVVPVLSWRHRRRRSRAYQSCAMRKTCLERLVGLPTSQLEADQPT